MTRTGDPIADFNIYDVELQRELAKLPVCDCCGEPIQDDRYYDIGSEILCKECLDSNYLRFTSDYMEE